MPTESGAAEAGRRHLSRGLSRRHRTDIAHDRRWTGRRSLLLNGRLNDQLEHEVEIIERAQPAEVRGHFDLVRRWRIMLSDRDAWSFGILELLIYVAMAAVLVRTCARPGVDAETIFAVLGYVLMYVSGIANVPLLVQQFSRLRDTAVACSLSCLEPGSRTRR